MTGINAAARAALLAALLSLGACAATPSEQHQVAAPSPLRVNDLQAVGTHNSYKLAIPANELALLLTHNPGAAHLDYAHAPLADQLSDGARVLELDPLLDPEGGRYAAPLGRALVGGTFAPGEMDALRGPGIKVLHVQDIDYRTSCNPLRVCLVEIRDWSNAHPDHAPILVTMNPKQGPSEVPGGVVAPDWDEAAYDALDAQIRAVFAADDLITPDDVQGDAPSLAEAARAGGWPLLSQARGRFIFALDKGPEDIAIYQGGRASLEGRVMFVNAPADSPLRAFRVMNEPVEQQAEIQAMVREGVIVRTRADADTLEARANDVRRRDAAFASGAQYVSTDYMTARPDFSPYTARIPGGAAVRCNPVRRIEACPAALE